MALEQRGQPRFLIIDHTDVTVFNVFLGFVRQHLHSDLTEPAS